jgi:hypothetical protein
MHAEVCRTMKISNGILVIVERLAIGAEADQLQQLQEPCGA